MKMRIVRVQTSAVLALSNLSTTIATSYAFDRMPWHTSRQVVGSQGGI